MTYNYTCDKRSSRRSVPALEGLGLGILQLSGLRGGYDGALIDGPHARAFVMGSGRSDRCRGGRPVWLFPHGVGASVGQHQSSDATRSNDAIALGTGGGSPDVEDRRFEGLLAGGHPTPLGFERLSVRHDELL